MVSQSKANGDGPNEAATNGTAQSSSAKTAKPNARVNVEAPLKKLQSILQSDWESYQDAVLDFITGKLTRNELDERFGNYTSANAQFAPLHNEAIMGILANAFRDPPPTTTGSSAWGRKRKEGLRKKGDAKAKKIKADVMALPYRERQRIKGMIKDPKRRPLPQPGILIETRIARLPKIPVTKDKVNSVFAHDVQKGYQAALASESHLMPDHDVLKDRMTAIALEHGLLGGISEGVPDMLLAGLEHHLKNNVTSALKAVHGTLHDQVGREDLPDKDKAIEDRVLTPNELALGWTLQPHRLIEAQPAQRRLEASAHSSSLRLEQDETGPETLPHEIRDNDPIWEQRLELSNLLDDILVQ